MNNLETKQERYNGYNLNSLENQKKIANYRREIVKEAKLNINKIKTYCKHCGKSTNSSSLCGNCYYEVHKWTRARVLKPINCKCCGKIKKLALTNNSQYYAYDINDWEYLCSACHNKKDGPFRNSVDRWKHRDSIMKANTLAVEFVKDELYREARKGGVYLDYNTGKRI